MFSGQVTALEDQDESIRSMSEPLISELKSNIKTVRAAGAKDEVLRLEAQLTSLVSQYNNSIGQISDAIEKLNKERDKVLLEI